MQTVRRSLLLSVASSYYALILQLASTVIIARLLPPAEIGVFAVASVFSALASMLRDFGVAEYMIQERELTREKVAATLGLNIIVSWTMALAIFAGGSAAAGFYRNPGIADVMAIQAIGFVLVPFGAVTMAYLRREMDFTPHVICSALGATTSFVVSVALALAGWGATGLACGAVAGIAATVVGSAFFRPAWFPRLPSLRGMGQVFHFAKFAGGVYIVAQLGKGSPELIIGRAQGMAEVAIYSRAGGLIEMFNKLALRPLMSVCMPYFANSHRAGQALDQAYLRTVVMVTGLGWPMLGFAAVASYSAIRIIYGPQWDAAVPLAQLLCAACALELVHVMSREVLLSKGEARVANNLQLGLVALQVLGLTLAIPYGLVGAAWGTVAAAAAGTILSQAVLSKAIGLQWGDMLLACSRSLIPTITVVAPALAWSLIEGVGPHNYVRYGLGAGALSVVGLLAGLRWSAHPLWDEVDALGQRALAWVSRRRRGRESS